VMNENGKEITACSKTNKAFLKTEDIAFYVHCRRA